MKKHILISWFILITFIAFCLGTNISNNDGYSFVGGNFRINTTDDVDSNGGGVLLLGDVDANSVTIPNATAGFYADPNGGGTTEMFVIDEADNATQISPHNGRGQWEFYSRNNRTGRVVRINMERFVQDYDRRFGTAFFRESRPLKGTLDETNVNANHADPIYRHTP